MEWLTWVIVQLPLKAMAQNTGTSGNYYDLTTIIPKSTQVLLGLMDIIYCTAIE